MCLLSTRIPSNPHHPKTTSDRRPCSQLADVISIWIRIIRWTGNGVYSPQNSSNFQQSLWNSQSCSKAKIYNRRAPSSHLSRSQSLLAKKMKSFHFIHTTDMCIWGFLAVCLCQASIIWLIDAYRYMHNFDQCLFHHKNHLSITKWPMSVIILDESQYTHVWNIYAESVLGVSFGDFSCYMVASDRHWSWINGVRYQPRHLQSKIDLEFFKGKVIPKHKCYFCFIKFGNTYTMALNLICMHTFYSSPARVVKWYITKVETSYCKPIEIYLYNTCS